MINYDEIIARIADVPLNKGRRIIAVAGAPASGKSTLAQRLAKLIEHSCVVPMDGFHRDNADLERDGLLARKGAPETFDVVGFGEVLAQLHSTAEVAYPTFDRSGDCVVHEGGQVTATDRTILVEGNYLLLDTGPWQKLACYWDFSIFLDVPIETLRERLINRWVEHGHNPDAALARAEGNDLPNARLVASASRVADLKVKAK